MLDIKNMTDNELINLIKLLKHELETRAPKNNCLCPRGEIKLILESSITNEKGQLMKNEPKTINFHTINPIEIEAIFNQDGLYPMLVNQLVERFKEGMWETQTGPLKLTRDEIYELQHIIFKAQHTLINENDSQLLKKLLTMLRGK